MAGDQHGFIGNSLEELRAHLRDELRKNPFIDVPQSDAGTDDDDDPPGAQEGSEKAAQP